MYDIKDGAHHNFFSEEFQNMVQGSNFELLKYWQIFITCKYFELIFHSELYSLNYIWKTVLQFIII